MTNGEKLKEVFPSIKLYEKSHDAIQINFDSVWWNAEYKDPTTKNDLGVDCISRAEVFQVLWNYEDIHHPSYDLIIKDIRALPSVTPQLSSELEKNSKKLEKDFGELDCIDRAELLKAMDTWDKFGYTETGCFVREPKGDYIPYVHYEDMVNCVKGMSSVTPQELKTGHWNDIPKYQDIAWHCSECEHFTTMKHNYCPKCGTKMVEPQESEG